MRYYVRLGDSEYEVTIEGEQVTLEGHTQRAHVEDLPGSPVHLVTIGSSIHRVLANRGNRKGSYDLSVDGYRFAAEALDERAYAIRELSGQSAAAAAPAHLVAPMPGLIVRVNVQAGDQVRAGQGLVVMEAMKMENELRATANGIVKRIAVQAGSAVEKGALLLEMEA